MRGLPRLPRILPVLSLLFLFVLLPSSAPCEPDQPDSSGRSPEAYSFLESAVDHSKAQDGFHLDVELITRRSDREDTIDILSKGIFRKPEFILMSTTPAGMQVTSYGNDRAIAHIDPSTDEVVTSEKLGIASVNRKMLDPFQHFKYLLKPDYEGFSCSFAGSTEINGVPHRIVRVEPGPEQIREVMEKFQDQLKRSLKPEKTRAEYRIFVEKDRNVVHRIKLHVESEAAPKTEGGRNDKKDKPDWQEELEKEEKKGQKEKNKEKSENDESPLNITIDGTFKLTDYNRDLSFTIPDDVRAKLKKWAKQE